MDVIAEKVAAAKLWLISQPPSSMPRPDSPRALAYLATAVYALRTVPSSDIATIRADQYWRLYVNPLWVGAISVPELGRELAHIVWHLLMDHAGRAAAMGVDAATSEQWHQACDLTVSETLVGEEASPVSVEDRSRQVRTDNPSLGRGRSAEDYFAILSRLPAWGGQQATGPLANNKDCGSACDGMPRASDLPPDSEVGRLDRIQAEQVREQVAIDYREAAKSRGDSPGEAQRWAKHITEPTIRWEPLLARAVRRGVAWASGRVERTWSRPSRRQSVQPEVLHPGWRRPLPGIAMVVDTSVSIDDELLGKAMGEVEGALRGLGVADPQVTVLACDASVGAVTAVRKATDATLVGGGGTDMRVGIAAASTLRPRPDLIVVLTDGYTPWPELPPPGSAVIAAILGRPGATLPETPPWVARVECVLR
ncbi:MAG TPA: VWA-like domain-containing protein [Propionicimonas sp.]|nr:VWA-like domain-containing protein [Propionicimonas sp.]